jgi:hypothetical protein
VLGHAQDANVFIDRFNEVRGTEADLRRFGKDDVLIPVSDGRRGHCRSTPEKHAMTAGAP